MLYSPVILYDTRRSPGERRPLLTPRMIDEILTLRT